MTRPDLDALAHAAGSGASDDMDRLLRGVRVHVCRWALVWTGDPDLVEEVAQRVSLRVFGSLASYSPSARFATWLYRLTRNVLIDVDREVRSRRSLGSAVALDCLATASPTPRDPTAKREAARLLRRLMNDLSPQQRSVLDLIELQGYSAVEVAQMMDLSASTVRVHLHRAKAAMRSQAESLRSVEGGIA